jgi:xanthine dehydrogenase YagR molybdenum-binding subunit
MPDPIQVQVPVGVVYDGGGQVILVDRTVAADEAPPLPVNAELSVVGKPAPRLDGRLKTTGAAVYTSDVRLPGMLYARIVRSPHPHAQIRSIDTKAAEQHPGVRAVHVLEHLRDAAILEDPSQEQPSSFPIVRYEGQPVAAVAAVTQADADEAAQLVQVDYEPLPFVVDLEAAMKPDAPLVFPGPAFQPATGAGGGSPAGIPQTGNVRGPVLGGAGFGPPSGDVEAGFAAADVIVEATYRTQVQTHSAMEAHGVVADWKADGLTVYASTQATIVVRDELAEVFDLPLNRIRVVTEFMGGGFGAKFSLGNYGVLAVHLSKNAGAPVRLMLDRKEEHLSVGNRPNSIQNVRIGAKTDGSLTAIHVTSHGTGGAGTGSGSASHARFIYPCPNLRTEEYDVFTTAGPAAAFRAPGSPQGCFAFESAIDELAEALAMDPIALRAKVDLSPVRAVERDIGAQKIGWAQRHPAGSEAGPVKRGMGMAQGVWPRFVVLDSVCEVRLMRDGTVEILSAVQDIGGGIRTALAQVVAEELGLQPSDISVRIGDTSLPSGPGSGGSLTTGSITPAARNAAYHVRQKFLAAIAFMAFGVTPEELAMKDGKVFVVSDPSHSLSFHDAAAKLFVEQIADISSRSVDYGGFLFQQGPFGVGIGDMGGVQFAEVSVDTETGIIKVERVVAVHDCGRPINPLALESQINGGILQGISYALYENRTLDKGSGLMVNANFEQYKVLGAREAPSIEIELVQEYRGISSTDASGIGEPSTIPTSAAIANAVYNAIGARVRELPMTPARVLEALAQKGAQ